MMSTVPIDSKLAKLSSQLSWYLDWLTSSVIEVKGPITDEYDSLLDFHKPLVAELKNPLLDDINNPLIDVVSYAFDKQRPYDETSPLYLNAANPEQSLSYAQIRVLVRQLIRGFQVAGLQPGDAVLVNLPNHYAYSALYLAVVGAGGIFCPINPGYKHHELEHLLRLCAPKFIITSEEARPKIMECEPPVYPENIITFDLDGICQQRQQGQETDGAEEDSDEESSDAKLSSFLCYGEAEWRSFRGEIPVKSTPAAYFSTSGTSGLPKLAVLSHYAMVALFQQVHQRVDYDVVRLAALPLFHQFGSAWALALTIRHGQPTYVMSRYRFDDFVRHIRDYRITETFMSPPVVKQMLDSRKAGDPLALRSALKSIRYIGVGGAPITAKTLVAFRALLHEDATLSGVWGTTEIGAVTMLPYGEEDISGSVGRPLGAVRVKVRQESEDEPADAPGEILISSPAVMMGYKDTPVPEEELKWYPTGDKGQIVDGKLYIIGRYKEIIKTKGWQVSPTEVEDILLSHPDIQDCAVVGVMKDDVEVPRAYVVPRAGAETLAGSTVYAFAASSLVSYKKLDGGVFFVEQIPRLASGKIQRFKLQDLQTTKMWSPDPEGLI
ncbi:hypothetical protein BX600DRAFT_492564 [Xylariales sp. PMI_506]|nr:hypothetical protein BX600DRAFT_492564 [Xylariales sp. PMI_506]